MYQKIFSVKNKTIIITGSNGVIGKKIVNTFKKLGAKTISIDINSKKPEKFENINPC